MFVGCGAVDMTGNRVEELEDTVAQLEATVSGLTDELVETKERLRLIEDHFGPELDDIIEGQTSRSSDPIVETTAASEPAETPQEAPQEAVDDAVGAATESADGSKPEETEGDDESAGTDDIIVA
jgi:uncharacterized coiled-coil protein SlyX